jgi:hypothetical protein
MKRFLLSTTPLFLTVTAFAQDATDSPASDDAANAAGALAALGCGILPCILGLVIQIALAVWVYKDATKRGMENAVLLTVVTALTGLIGLLIYLLMRPKTPPVQ